MGIYYSYWKKIDEEYQRQGLTIPKTMKFAEGIGKLTYRVYNNKKSWVYIVYGEAGKILKCCKAFKQKRGSTSENWYIGKRVKRC